jgi:hypothetical protein
MFMMTQIAPFKRFHTEERGQTAIMMVLVLLGVFAFMALALDFGVWYVDHRHAQNEVDAAAAAAGQALPCAASNCGSTPSTSCSGAPPITAVGLATYWLACNGANGSAAVIAYQDNSEKPSCGTLTSDTVKLVFSKFQASGGNYGALRICVSRSSASLFYGLSAVIDPRVSAKATAVARRVPASYAMMVMNAGNGTVQMNGTSQIDLGTNSLYINSTSASAINVSGTSPCPLLPSAPSNPCFTARSNDVNGTATDTAFRQSCCVSRTRQVPAQPDPFVNSSVNLESIYIQAMKTNASPWNSDCSTSSVSTLASNCCYRSQPTWAATVTAPGNSSYCFKLGSVTLPATLTSSGPVLLYFGCPSSGACKISVDGPSHHNLTLTGRTLTSGSFSANVAIWMERTATSASKLDYKVIDTLNINGVVYAPTATAQLGPNMPTNAQLSIVVGSVNIQGNATMGCTGASCVSGEPLTEGSYLVD